MRVIELKEEPFAEEALKGGSEKEALIGVVRFNKDGFTLDEIRLGLRVLDKLEGPGTALALEEAEWGFLCRRLRATKWLVASREVIEMIDRIEAAKEEKPAKVSP